MCRRSSVESFRIGQVVELLDVIGGLAGILESARWLHHSIGTTSESGEAALDVCLRHQQAPAPLSRLLGRGRARFRRVNLNPRHLSPTPINNSIAPRLTLVWQCAFERRDQLSTADLPVTSRASSRIISRHGQAYSPRALQCAHHTTSPHRINADQSQTSNPTEATMSCSLVILTLRPSSDPMAPANPTRRSSLPLRRASS